MDIGREEAGQDEIRGQRTIGIVTPFKDAFKRWCEEKDIANKSGVHIVWISKKEDCVGIRFDEVKKGINWNLYKGVWEFALTRLKTPLAKTGIVCDDYKVDRYKEVLEERGFDNYEVLFFMKGVSQIHVMVDPSQVGEIQQMCKALELGFARANKKKRRNRRY